jgi:hypothetical protein
MGRNPLSLTVINEPPQSGCPSQRLTAQKIRLNKMLNSTHVIKGK